MRKIDCHMHVSGGPQQYPGCHPENVVRAADRLGIERLVCSIPVTGGRQATPEEVRACNDGVLVAMRAFPKRILGYCFINPGNGPEALAEIDRCVVRGGMVGIKLYNQFKINDPVVFPVIERTIALGVPVLSHAGRLQEPELGRQPLTSHAADFIEVGRRYPEVMLIHGHLAGGGDWEWSLKVLRQAPRSVFVDTSGSVMDAGLIDRAVRELGEQRLLFGTDMTMEGGVAKIMDAALTEAQRERIFWRNFQGLLDRRRGG